MQIDELLRSEKGKKELTEISKKHAKVVHNQKMDALNVGCTACVVLITESEIYVANVGDSRCVVCKNGVVIALSREHKPEVEEEKKRILSAGGYIEEGRVNGVLNLSRTLGDLEYKKNKKLEIDKQIIIAMPDVVVEKIEPGTEFLVIACDGVWDSFTNNRAINVFRNKIWDITNNKPKRVKLSKIISDVFDSIIAADLVDESKLKVNV